MGLTIIGGVFLAGPVSLVQKTPLHPVLEHGHSASGVGLVEVHHGRAGVGHYLLDEGGGGHLCGEG